MLPPRLIPTPLILATERTPMTLVGPAGLPRFRAPHLIFAFVKVMLGLGLLRLVGKLTPTIAGQRIRHFLEEQGFLWVKVGQLLSLREDVFSTDFCRELSKLQFQARGFPLALARQTLEADLGGPLESVFSEFDEMPFAAASISQVHRAVLRTNGAGVAVKVQRPNVQSLFARDMTLVQNLVWLVRSLRIMPYMRWDDLVWELTTIVVEEIDYRYEMSNLRRMRVTLRPHRVFVPEVFEEWSGQRVLVMEYMPGVLMSDFVSVRQTDPARLRSWLKENNINPRRVGQRLFISFLRQLMEDNLFHGDLHPGNIVLLRNSRIAFIDLGTIGMVETEFLQLYLQHIKALAERQYETAADRALRFCPDIPPIDVADLKEKLIQCYRNWELRSSLPNLTYSERSLSRAAEDANPVLFEKGVVASMMYLKMGRTFKTLDASLSHLVPEVNYPRLIRRYFREAQKRSRRWSRAPKAVLKGVIDRYEAIAEASQLLGPLLARRALAFAEHPVKLMFCVVALIRTLRLALALLGLAWGLRFLEEYFENLLADHSQVALLHRTASVAPELADSRWYLLAALAVLTIFFWLGRLGRRLR